jgi:hypothetical protein
MSDLLLDVDGAVSAFIAYLGPGDGRNTVVQVRGQTLAIPYRLYTEPHRSILASERRYSEAHMFALCLGTRHCNGFIREKYIRELVHIDHPLVVPFVVCLLGEYVIELVKVIVAALPDFNRETYGEFVRDNLGFMYLTKQRAISYWDCYYRAPHLGYRRPSDYPGFVALEQIEQMATVSSGA